MNTKVKVSVARSIATLMQQQYDKGCPFCDHSLRGNTWKNLNGEGTLTCRICENSFPTDKPGQRAIRRSLRREREFSARAT